MISTLQLFVLHPVSVESKKGDNIIFGPNNSCFVCFVRKKQANKQTSKQRNKETDKQTNKQTNKQPTNQPNKQTNKQTPWTCGVPSPGVCPGVSQLRAGAAVAAESGIQHQAAVATDVGERVAVQSLV